MLPSRLILGGPPQASPQAVSNATQVPNWANDLSRIMGSRAAGALTSNFRDTFEDLNSNGVPNYSRYDRLQCKISLCSFFSPIQFIITCLIKRVEHVNAFLACGNCPNHLLPLTQYFCARRENLEQWATERVVFHANIVWQKVQGDGENGSSIIIFLAQAKTGNAGRRRLFWNIPWAVGAFKRNSAPSKIVS